jgi:hypothetical protein
MSKSVILLHDRHKPIDPIEDNFIKDFVFVDDFYFPIGKGSASHKIRYFIVESVKNRSLLTETVLTEINAKS